MYKKFKWLTVLIAAVLVVMTGCQAVGDWISTRRCLPVSMLNPANQGKYSIRGGAIGQGPID